MLDKLIQKLRGIDRWPETEAKVVSSEIVSEGGYNQPPPSARIAFYYRDSKEETQSGEMAVDSYTSLYNLQVDDTFTIRFNPRKPSQFYSEEAGSSFTQLRFILWLLIGGIILAVLSIGLLSHQHR